MGFGIKLKEILKRKGITIKELSELSGISLNTLYSITKRDTQTPSIDIVNKIAAVLEIDDSELMTYEILNHEIHSKLDSLKESECILRKKLQEICEMLNTDALYELLDEAVEMLQDETYRSIFFKKQKDNE